MQRYIDAATLTPEKLNEVYSYFGLLVDLHIAQVRPGIYTEKDYTHEGMNTFNPFLDNDYTVDNKFIEHYHRWREPPKIFEYFEKKLEAERSNLPTTDHYEHGKGTKYDVEWTDDMKFPHVATRLGFPQLCESPIERILGLERAQAHPGYQLQPFVQTPSMDPDSTLNFELGEVIYENNKVAEWIKFWKVTTAIFCGLSPAFYIFEIYAADGVPSLQWVSDNWFWFEIPRQF